MTQNTTLGVFHGDGFLALAAKLPYGEWITPSRVNKDGKAMKAGSSGIIGNDIEMRLGVPINNLKTADFGEGPSRCEIKSKRNGCATLHTLFNKNPTFWNDPFAPKRKKGKKGANPRIADRFSYAVSPNDPVEGRYEKYIRTLHLTWGANEQKNVDGEFGDYVFDITIDADFTRLNVFERNKIGTAIFYAGWENKILFDQAEEKFGGSLACFHYDIRGEKGNEEYCLTSFTRYSGYSQDNLVNALRSGEIKFDIALSKYRHKNGARDHGTGFRISEDNLPKLYAVCDVVFSA